LDIPRIIAINIEPHQVLAGLQQKSILLPATVIEIEAGLAERDALPNPHGDLSPASPNPQNSQNHLQHPRSDSATSLKANGVTRLDKRQIEQRIEEDRERHKRLRESIWAVGDDEFERLWEEGGGLDEDDWVVAREDRVERRVVGSVE